jgi:hypothetical protein
MGPEGEGPLGAAQGCPGALGPSEQQFRPAAGRPVLSAGGRVPVTILRPGRRPWGWGPHDTRVDARHMGGVPNEDSRAFFACAPWSCAPPARRRGKGEELRSRFDGLAGKLGIPKPNWPMPRISQRWLLPSLGAEPSAGTRCRATGAVWRGSGRRGVLARSRHTASWRTSAIRPGAIAAAKGAWSPADALSDPIHRAFSLLGDLLGP